MLHKLLDGKTDTALPQQLRVDALIRRKCYRSIDIPSYLALATKPITHTASPNAVGIVT
jgi:hypothetical protein